MAEFKAETHVSDTTTASKSPHEHASKFRDNVKKFKERVKNMKNRVKSKTKEIKDKFDNYRDNIHNSKVKRLNQRVERAQKDIELKNKIIQVKQAKRAIKTEAAQSKIKDLQNKTELKKAKQQYQVDKHANARRYADVASKVINGESVSSKELNSYKGDVNKRINFTTMARTTRDPVKKARYHLEAELNSHSPAVRAQAVQTYQTMMNDAKIAKNEKLKDYQASRDRKALLGKEAIKAAGIAAAAQALIGKQDDDE